MEKHLQEINPCLNAKLLFQENEDNSADVETARASLSSVYFYYFFPGLMFNVSPNVIILANRFRNMAPKYSLSMKKQKTIKQVFISYFVHFIMMIIILQLICEYKSIVYCSVKHI